MFFSLDKVFENPLLVAGILFLVAVFFYLVFELINMKNKSKEQKSDALFGWGVLLIIVAIILLFTTTVSFVVNSVYNESNSDFTLYELKKICSADKLKEVNFILKPETRDTCRIVDASNYVSYALFILGPIFIIFGLYIKTLYIKEKKKDS